MRASVASNVGTAVHVVLSWCHEHLLELQIHSWKSSTNKRTNPKNNIKALLCCVHKTRVNTEPAQWDRVGFLDGLVRTDALRSAFTTLLNLSCFRLPESQPPQNHLSAIVLVCKLTSIALGGCVRSHSNCVSHRGCWAWFQFLVVSYLLW